MAKIEPVRDSSKEELRRVYSERYRQTFFTSFNGIHLTIIHNTKGYYTHTKTQTIEEFKKVYFEKDYSYRGARHA